MERPQYWGWFDDNVKKSYETKLREGIIAYLGRYGVLPTLILMEADQIIPVANFTIKLDGVETKVDGGLIAVRSEVYIRKDNFGML